MSRAPLRRVALAFICEATSSGAQTVRAVAADRNQYWCKFPHNEHGELSLVCEVFVSVLGRALGAPLPEAVLVEVPAGLAGERDARGHALGESVGFGSLNVEMCTTGTEILHGNEDGNPSRMPRLMALAELCMAQDLQVVYQDEEDNRVFGIDFDMWLGNLEPNWNISRVDPVTTYVRKGLFTDTDWYSVEWSVDGLLEARQAVSDLTLDDFTFAAKQVPVEWHISDTLLNELAHALYGRKSLTLETLDYWLARGGGSDV